MKCINCQCEMEKPPQSTANKYDNWCDKCLFIVPQIKRWSKVTQQELEEIEKRAKIVKQKKSREIG